jgi:hypothetical protein
VEIDEDEEESEGEENYREFEKVDGNYKQNGRPMSYFVEKGAEIKDFS